VIDRIRTRAIWLAIGLVFGGSAFAFAGASNVGSTHKPEVSPSKSKSHATTETKGTETETEEAAEHPENHGKYVSGAAHCENVNDEANSITFTAPADCETNGKAKGAYVSSVAKSKAGKTAHEPGGPEEGGED
jgi:hypothetical protein